MVKVFVIHGRTDHPVKDEWLVGVYMSDEEAGEASVRDHDRRYEPNSNFVYETTTCNIGEDILP